VVCPRLPAARLPADALIAYLRTLPPLPTEKKS